MAFDVTPTSGAGPYSLTASILNPGSIDGINYTASVLSSSEVGSCPLFGNQLPLTGAQLDTLISGGSVTLGTVPEGSCRTYTLSVTRVNGNVVVDSSNVMVDNV